MPPSRPKRPPLPSRAALARLLDIAPDAMVVVDSEGRIVLVNPAAETMFGYSREEMAGATVELLVPEADRGRHLAARETYTAEPRRRPMGAGLDLRGRRRDGSEFPVEISLNPLQTAEGPLVASAIRDVTEHRQAQVQRERLIREQSARVEAERANRMKDEFLHVLSHELRTPLNSIVGWAHILMTGEVDEETRTRALQTILRNARIQTQLISDMLDLSRISTGRIQLAVRRTSLGKVVDAAMDSLRPAAEGRAVALELVSAEDPGPLLADPDRLQQVVWNLLSNAVKFTGRGGRVTVTLVSRGDEVELTVSDTGQGIDPEFLPHVFDAFRQADASTSRQHGGLGLGLAIVRHLVELHGGTVRASSPGPGRGATFAVTLPLMSDGERRAQPRPHPPEAQRPMPRLRGVRVLLVEDDPDSREMVRELLERQEAEVHAVGSAEECYGLVRQQRPEVLVADIEMPGEDGYSLMRRVRELPVDEGGLTPAVALTAHARVEDRSRALASGYQYHLPKPVDPVELASVIASLAGHTRDV